MTSSELTGHCLCGAMTYRLEGEPMMTVMCHCEDCQRQSGSAFSMNIVADRGAFHMAGTTLATYKTVGADTGEERERQFCSTCGSSLVTLLAEAPDMTVIKAGTLDDRSSLMPGVEIWCDSAQSWFAGTADERGLFPRGLPG